jgi:hypothetical protein
VTTSKLNLEVPNWLAEKKGRNSKKGKKQKIER